MALSNHQYESILRDYEKKQLRIRHQLENKLTKIYDEIPAYAQLEEQIASLSIAHGIRKISGNHESLPDLDETLREITRKKQSLLTGAGYPLHYLEPEYECTRCKDTGYLGNEKCQCFKQSITRLLYEQSNIELLLLSENFDTLSYEYYQGEDLRRFENAVNTCRNFVKNFNSDYHNLFFYGTVGTGKSFLSSCIAKDLLDDGKIVIYFSATQFFELLAKATFDARSKDDSNNIQADIATCDLLIIDDLGTELCNAFVSSQLFACLNRRHLARKSTVISTNLSLEELRDRYSDRIFSRISSQFEICKITGPDIRMYKKRQMNRK